jgi:hypothetical protein
MGIKRNKVRSSGKNNSPALLLYDMDRTETVATEALCLTAIKGIRTDTHYWEGFIKYVVEIGSGAMMYKPTLMTIGLVIQMLRGGFIYT